MNPYSTELRHHGILGQRWGKKNGPPYPLDAEDHSSSEKKAGWRKSIDDVKGGVTKAANKVKDKYNNLSDRDKTIVKRAGVAAATTATVSAVQTAKNAKFANWILEDYGKMNIKYVIGKGAVQAGKVAAVAALATVGAHKIKDSISERKVINEATSKASKSVTKKELAEYRKQKISEAPSREDVGAYSKAATKGWWKNMPEANLSRHYAEEKGIQAANKFRKEKGMKERRGY